MSLITLCLLVIVGVPVLLGLVDAYRSRKYYTLKHHKLMSELEDLEDKIHQATENEKDYYSKLKGDTE